MSSATLSISASVTGGGMTRDIELQLCKRVTELALQDARSAGGTKTSGTTITEGNASATWSYTPVASK
jgi:hypothetical protein